MDHNISGGRKIMYYLGMVLIAIGIIMFLSTFLSSAANFGDFHNFEQRAQQEFSRAVTGMILMVVGSVLMGIGRMGVAGSGLVLDPKKAREDVKPWTKMAGGMLKDAIEEVDVAKGITNKKSQNIVKEVIKIKCPSCGILNDEDAKFCKDCGKGI